MSSFSSTKSSDLKVEIQEDFNSIENEPNLDPLFVRRTIRLVDWRMLPLLALLYSVALIDRTNLGIARTAGMERDLKLHVGERYSLASMIYFIPYTLLQLPANVFLRWMGARVLLTTCVVGWGIAQLSMSFVSTWGHLALCRIFLGVFESGFFPSLVFIITTWYKRYEVQKRLAIFYLTSIVIGGFSSIIAYGITFLKGKSGLNGWQWIFLLEGAFTILLGVLAWLYIPDFPDKCKFITAEQRQTVLARVEQDRGDSIPDPITPHKVIKHLGDPVMWAFAFMFFATTVPAYAVVFFVTIILKGMGYTEARALILTCPPSIAAAVACFGFAWIADRTRTRARWLLIQNCICITGLMVTAYAKQNGVRYFGIFLVNSGATSAVPCVLAYSANNITTHSKRAVQTATIVASGGIGGIVATMVYRQKDYPRYLNGLWATMALQLTMMFLVVITMIVFSRRNRLRRQGKIGLLEDRDDFYYTI